MVIEQNKSERMDPAEAAAFICFPKIPFGDQDQAVFGAYDARPVLRGCHRHNGNILACRH